MFRPEDFLDFSACEHRALFESCSQVWEALRQIGPYLKFRLQPGMEGTLIGNPFIGKDVFIGEGTVVEPGAYIQGPAWIGRNCVVRHGAYVRGQVIIGNHCVLGNSCEFKNCILFDGCEVPHFAYVGDSILGHKAHLGAGVICSNVRLDRREIVVRAKGQSFETGLRKFGAIVGDGCEVGCHSVLNPGSILGRGAKVMPGTIFVGVLEAGGIGRSQR
ncbi:MAG: glucose-1-phosphate thymidylyltransferase [Candidatus Methylacidiphilales bacterium]